MGIEYTLELGCRFNKTRYVLQYRIQALLTDPYFLSHDIRRLGSSEHNHSLQHLRGSNPNLETRYRRVLSTTVRRTSPAILTFFLFLFLTLNLSQGKELLELAPTAKGPALAGILNLVIRYQLRNPTAGKEECRSWIIGMEGSEKVKDEIDKVKKK